ncbi:MAG TPA: GDP-mannose 4,6-dehydratase [Gemmatimonadales bacterium]|nr:GDP-mannose 4,6-dehydratase [Gemmatimonadales bacterium]
MKILVTGADGFVGRWLVPRLLTDGHTVTAAVRPGGTTPADWTTVPLELGAAESVQQAVAGGYEAVVHLAAVASGRDARQDPGTAWEVNAAGTARVAEALGAVRGEGKTDPILLLVSTAEVYGAGATPPVPRREDHEPAPCSAYAASKLAAEIAAAEVARRTGLRVIVARPFPHTGRGQDGRFVIPAFTKRLLAAARTGEREIRVGNLDPVRDFLHVSDVVDAYARLIVTGRPGEVYNVASGFGVSIGELFERLRGLIGCNVCAKVDPELVRPADIAHLVGDATKLRHETGWEPHVSLDDTLNEVVGAQAD